MKGHAVCPPGAFYSSGRTQVEVNSAMPCHGWTADLLCICALFWRWQSKFSPQVIPWPLAHVRWELAGQGQADKQTQALLGRTLYQLVTCIVSGMLCFRTGHGNKAGYGSVFGSDTGGVASFCVGC